jgi:hypothetical protein
MAAINFVCSNETHEHSEQIITTNDNGCGETVAMKLNQIARIRNKINNSELLPL